MIAHGRHLAACLDAASAAGRGSMAFHLGDRIDRWSAARVAERARHGAAVLEAQGVRPGDRVGLAGPNAPEWLVGAFAIWSLGAVLVPLPDVRAGDEAAADRRRATLAAAAGCRAALTAPTIAVEQLGASVQVIGWELDAVSARAAASLPDVDPAAPAVVQLTSGSTDAPKGVVLSHRSILAAVELASAATGVLAHRDHLAGWLPFFHDYGLFGFLVRPFVLGLDADVLPVARFLRDPARWFDLLTTTGATMTAAPPSAWAGALRRIRPEHDLRNLRLGILAAESIDPAVLDRLHAAAPQLHLDPGAIAAAYGLAEATLGVSATPAGADVRVEHLDRAELAAGRAVTVDAARPHRAVVSCGQVFNGLEVSIAASPADDDATTASGRCLPERRIGEVRVRGPSLLTGYLMGDTVTDPRSPDGWLPTGDLGYLADGELFITGRVKEVVIVRGQNHAPEDLERAAATVPGVRRGRCVAGNHPKLGDGHVLVLVEVAPGSGSGRAKPAPGVADEAEPPAASPDLPAITAGVRAAIASEVGLTVAEVAVLPRGSVYRTSSGKLQRRATGAAYVAGQLEVLHHG
jgi:fatty-acyl-CoA synthase